MLCQLVETHLSSIKSGWRPIFAALRNMPVYSRKLTDLVEPDHTPQQILDILSAFLTNKNSSVFAAAAVQCIQTLLKFVRGWEGDDVSEGSRSDSDSNDNSDTGTANELCLPALQDLLNMSKKLASIYIMPSSLVFHGSRAIRLVEHTPEYPGTHSPISSPIKPNESSNRKPKTQTPTMTSATSIASIDDTGVLRVWFLLLEGLTKVVAQCPCKFQPQTLEVLFDILRSITTVPGPHFSIYVVTNLLLPMLDSWVERGNRDGSYWENTAGNFKHACGLVTELVVEELGQFLSVQGELSFIAILDRVIFEWLDTNQSYEHINSSSENQGMEGKTRFDLRLQGCSRRINIVMYCLKAAREMFGAVTTGHPRRRKNIKTKC